MPETNLMDLQERRAMAMRWALPTSNVVANPLRSIGLKLQNASRQLERRSSLAVKCNYRRKYRAQFKARGLTAHGKPFSGRWHERPELDPLRGNFKLMRRAYMRIYRGKPFDDVLALVAAN